MKKLYTGVLLLLLTIGPSLLWAQSEVAVYQESSPGRGDFEANFLGCIDVFDQSGFTAAEVYQYGNPLRASYNGSVTPSIPDTSQLFFVNTSEGLSLFVVHDQPQDGDGGGAEMRFEISGDPDGAARLVEDDPGDTSRTGNLFGPDVLQTHHRWSPCCTDGVVIGALDDDWSMLVSFSDVDGSADNEIVGIAEWKATSADSTLVPLDLVVDQRVLVEPCIIGETICGSCEVTDIQIYESQPCDDIDCSEFIRPCNVGFIFTTPNQQVYNLSGRAYGTALNLALLKAGNFGEVVSCCFTYRFVLGFDIEIDYIDFGSSVSAP